MSRLDVLDILLREPIKTKRTENTSPRDILLKNLIEQLRRADSRAARHPDYLLDAELLAELILEIEKQ